ncbi:MAG: hypothetical protein SD837_10935 [Candidatus Electrothrix scaldis]|nr:MAG: hypothetical protein SD837_10935 [Candidatus Electrothrix sp. GW3-3]
MKNLMLKLCVVLTATAIFSSPAAAAAQINTASIQAKVDELITKMQQETIKKNFAARILQNEMRTKMMAERVPQKFMQTDILPIVQPAMIEKVRKLMQAQMMEALKVR